VVAGVAVVVAIIFWNYYIRSPWTRDGRVRVEVVKIASEVAGKILAVPVVDNQMVQKGDVLFVIDPATYELRLAQATALVLDQAIKPLLQHLKLKGTPPRHSGAGLPHIPEDF
jgi:multidrug resistance efflux pump